jgi:uncharacterized protein
MVVAYYRRRLDLAEVVREQIVLAVPLRRLCREDCRGLCPSCGTNQLAACLRDRGAGRPAPGPLRKLFDKH